MSLEIPLDVGRAACADSITAFLRAVGDLSEYDLLAGSRCHGWTRLDVVVHVTAGWQEMLGGLVSVVDSRPTVDAASYWSAFASEYGGEDPIASLMSQRRRTSSYGRPASAVAHLNDVAAAVLRGVGGLRDGGYAWQGHVFAAGDFAAVWAVEDVVHHLDLLIEDPAPEGALQLARSTIEALLGSPLPSSFSDEDVTLIGSGRSPVPSGFDSLSDRLPVLA